MGKKPMLSMIRSAGDGNVIWVDETEVWDTGLRVAQSAECESFLSSATVAAAWMRGRRGYADGFSGYSIGIPAACILQGSMILAEIGLQ